MNFKGIYCCHFGCDGEFTTKSELVEHLCMKHTASELLLWGYKKDKLKKLISGGFSTKLPSSWVGEGQAIVDPYEKLKMNQLNH